MIVNLNFFFPVAIPEGNFHNDIPVLQVLLHVVTLEA